MKIDIVSDLHVNAHFHETKPVYKLGEGPQHFKPGSGREKYQHFDFEWHRNIGSRCIIIAGDIANDVQTAIDVLRDASENYEYVLYCDGNHEHYGDIPVLTPNNVPKRNIVRENIQIFQKAVKSIPNLIYLDGIDNTHFILDRVMFIGGNGWYDWKCFEPKISVDLAKQTWLKQSNDSVRINFDGFDSPDVLAFNQAENFASLVERAQNSEHIDEIIVFTHTSPRTELMIWYEGSDWWNFGTPSYVNSQMSKVVKADVNKKISHWIYGHTHDRNFDKQDHIVYINNAYGYPREAKYGDLWRMKRIETRDE